MNSITNHTRYNSDDLQAIVLAARKHAEAKLGEETRQSNAYLDQDFTFIEMTGGQAKGDVIADSLIRDGLVQLRSSAKIGMSALEELALQGSLPPDYFKFLVGCLYSSLWCGYSASWQTEKIELSFRLRFGEPPVGYKEQASILKAEVLLKRTRIEAEGLRSKIKSYSLVFQHKTAIAEKYRARIDKACAALEKKKKKKKKKKLEKK